jgi:hypothetical protein
MHRNCCVEKPASTRIFAGGSLTTDELAPIMEACHPGAQPCPSVAVSTNISILAAAFRYTRKHAGIGKGAWDRAVETACDPKMGSRKARKPLGFWANWTSRLGNTFI